ncbi:hypothetical protein C2E21_9284 [Chlorella sorokiniana]|uniref:Uncharacterized protein n=1 Tax=Chlorella sorokiniana TaxID=3076 RepID=A0A2P6TBS5_CHLSO|nr:hypothetical protein C2E21_9284 [Chlorella sorokiniana]|eukprot:PRW18325.1 hypothetical protein C2E21_9284 [Chlorella sorokiniana]
MEAKTVKPVLGGIPLVVETSGAAFSCAAPPRLDTPSPDAGEETPHNMRRRSASLWRRTTDDGDMLEMEYARKKLGLTPSGKKKKGLLGMFSRKKNGGQ